MEVSIIIPTRNRRYSIEKTIASYIEQKFVKEIIFIDDAGEDNLKEYIQCVNSTTYIDLVYASHDVCRGAAAGRNTGLSLAKYEFVLFGEDDVFLESNYVEKLVSLMNSSKEDEVLVSGRIIMLKSSENLEGALARFKQGVSKGPLLDRNSLTINFDSITNETTMSVPFTHAIFMGKKDVLLKYGFDEFYFPGNGYREESDLQMKLFVNGGKVLIFNHTHCFHMARSTVRTGGQRINRIRQYLYCLKYNSYFFDKYYIESKPYLDLNRSLNHAKIIFSVSLFFKMFVLPLLRILK